MAWCCVVVIGGRSANVEGCSLGIVAVLIHRPMESCM